MKKIRITQIRSGIGKTIRQKRTLEALGLKRIRHTRRTGSYTPDTGHGKKVEHLVKVEEI